MIRNVKANIVAIFQSQKDWLWTFHTVVHVTIYYLYTDMIANWSGPLKSKVQISEWGGDRRANDPELNLNPGHLAIMCTIDPAWSLCFRMIEIKASSGVWKTPIRFPPLSTPADWGHTSSTNWHKWVTSPHYAGVGACFLSCRFCCLYTTCHFSYSDTVLPYFTSLTRIIVITATRSRDVFVLTELLLSLPPSPLLQSYKNTSLDLNVHWNIHEG